MAESEDRRAMAQMLARQAMTSRMREWVESTGAVWKGSALETAVAGRQPDPNDVAAASSVLKWISEAGFVLTPKEPEHG